MKTRKYLAEGLSPSLMGIVLLFGFGNGFDSVVSFVAYLWMIKNEKDGVSRIHGEENPFSA